MFTTINTIIGYRFKGRKSGKFKTIYFGMNFGQNGTNMWTVGTGSCAH